MAKIKDAMLRGEYPIERREEYQHYTLIGDKKFYKKEIVDDMDDNSSDTEHERSLFNEDYESRTYGRYAEE